MTHTTMFVTSLVLALFVIVCSATFPPKYGGKLEDLAKNNGTQENRRRVGDSDLENGGNDFGARIVRNRRAARDNRIPQMDAGQQVIDITRPRIHLAPRLSSKYGGCFSNYSLDFSWQTDHEIKAINMSMVHGDNFIQVPQDGVYFVYAQLYFIKNPYKTGHCITKGYLNDMDVPVVNEYVCSTHVSSDKYSSQTKYVGRPIYLKEKDIVGVSVRNFGEQRRLSRIMLLDKKLDYFGAYLM